MDSPSKPGASQGAERKPQWLKVRAPGGEQYARVKRTLDGLQLNTVCREAHCPNVGECWSRGTATVMVLGDTCTRGCRFCAVKTGNPRGTVDAEEPERVAAAVAKLELKYVVLTMVDRDDLADGGAAHVRAVVEALHRVCPNVLVEALVGDFGGRQADVFTVVEGAPEVFAHNIEVVRRITPIVRDRRCSYDRSLEVLARAKRLINERACDVRRPRFVKSSVMVGIGETDEEVAATLADLRHVGVDIVTLGQYLRPSVRHSEVARFVEPERFAHYRQIGHELGFSFVASDPLVRSSYRAAEAFVMAQARGRALEDEPSLKGREGIESLPEADKSL